MILEASFLESQGVVKKDDDDFPLLLSLIPGCPKELYYKGDIGILKLPAIAIVGSRSSTDYGRWAAYTIAKRLSDHGICVVSGMAEGIDTAAHRGALAGKTPTVAVLGTGLGMCFPRSNMGLMREISETGLLLSEYEDSQTGAKYTFPARNRIISGLAFATVVVEAGFSSGSLITAELAATQGREVYAVPGNINRRSSAGCNKLIADGARPVALIDDILTDMGITAVVDATLDKNLTANERIVMEMLQLYGELTYDRLATETRLSIGTITSVVTMLEIKNYLTTGGGKIFLNNSLTS